MRNCDLCGNRLEPVFPEFSRRSGDEQFEDCLHIRVWGGYGEYIDGRIDIDLCESCADKFIELNPKIEKLMRWGLDDMRWGLDD